MLESQVLLIYKGFNWFACKSVNPRYQDSRLSLVHQILTPRSLLCLLRLPPLSLFILLTCVALCCPGGARAQNLGPTHHRMLAHLSTTLPLPQQQEEAHQSLGRVLQCLRKRPSARSRRCVQRRATSMRGQYGPPLTMLGILQSCFVFGVFVTYPVFSRVAAAFGLEGRPLHDAPQRRDCEVHIRYAVHSTCLEFSQFKSTCTCTALHNGLLL